MAPLAEHGVDGLLPCLAEHAMVLLDLRPACSLTSRPACSLTLTVSLSLTLTVSLSLTLTLTLTLTLARYWTTDQPIFTAMHGLLTFVSGGVFLVYLRATVKPYISPRSPLYLPYISPISPLYLPRVPARHGQAPALPLALALALALALTPNP